MTASAHVIGVDIGTQSTKAVLVTANGRLIAQSTRSYQVESPRPLWAEQWPQTWLDAVVACVAELMQRANVAPGAVEALCVSSLYGGSGIPVDAAGEPVYPCLIWMDRRAQEQVQRVRTEVDLERLYDITGNG